MFYIKNYIKGKHIRGFSLIFKTFSISIMIRHQYPCWVWADKGARGRVGWQAAACAHHHKQSVSPLMPWRYRDCLEQDLCHTEGLVRGKGERPGA